MRTLALLVAASVALVALAGCSGAGGAAAARSAYPSARDRAAAWDPDAVLLAILSFEVVDAQNATARLESEISASAADEPAAAPYVQPIIDLMRAVVADGDSQPGDGYAPAWAHMFVSAKGVHAVVVDHAGSVTYDRDFLIPGAVGPSSGLPPMAGLDGEWAVDSDEAARIARENNTAYGALVGRPDAVATMELEMDDGGPVWTLSIGRLEDRTAAVRVDATTGKVLYSYPSGPGTPTGPSRSPAPPAPRPTQVDREGDVDEGTLVAVASDDDDGTFTIMQDGHRRIRFVLEALDAVGPVDLRATVTDPEGTEHELAVGGLGTGTYLMHAVDATDVPDGEWEYEVVLAQGAVQDYRLSWCTDGREVGEAEDNPACSGIGGSAAAWLPGVLRLR